jgi:formate dehydrogenase subunit gamma
LRWWDAENTGVTDLAGSCGRRLRRHGRKSRNLPAKALLQSAAEYGKGLAMGRLSIGQRRALVAIALAVVAIISIIAAWRLAYASGTDLLFNSGWPLIFVALFAGFGAAAISKRHDPEIVGDKVLRHDSPAMLSHWTHAFGTVALLITGLSMGCLIIPNVLGTAQTNAMMNVHFVAALFFLFGTCYHVGNSIIAPRRFREHMPDEHSMDYTLKHFRIMLGSKKVPPLDEEKYLGSERTAYLGAIGIAGLVGITGIFKVLAHVVSLPAGFMNVVFFLHDAAAILMLLFLIAHVFFAVFAPHAFPNLIAMTTGWMSVEHASEEHPKWVRDIRAAGRVSEGTPETSTDNSCGTVAVQERQ